MINLKSLSLDDQVKMIFGGFFPDYEVGKWHGVDASLYQQARFDLESKTKYLLNCGADPEKLLMAYRRIARSKDFVELGNIWVLVRDIGRFYDEAIAYLGI